MTLFSYVFPGLKQTVLRWYGLRCGWEGGRRWGGWGGAWGGGCYWYFLKPLGFSLHFGWLFSIFAKMCTGMAMAIPASWTSYYDHGFLPVNCFWRFVSSQKNSPLTFKFVLLHVLYLAGVKKLHSFSISCWLGIPWDYIGIWCIPIYMDNL